MTDQFGLVERIFEAALELEPEEREAFLERECAGQEALRREVESLLASHREAQGFFGEAALADAVKLYCARHQMKLFNHFKSSTDEADDTDFPRVCHPCHPPHPWIMSFSDGRAQYIPL